MSTRSTPPSVPRSSVSLRLDCQLSGHELTKFYLYPCLGQASVLRSTTRCHSAARYSSCREAGRLMHTSKAAFPLLIHRVGDLSDHLQTPQENDRRRLAIARHLKASRPTILYTATQQLDEVTSGSCAGRLAVRVGSPFRGCGGWIASVSKSTLSIWPTVRQS